MSARSSIELTIPAPVVTVASSGLAPSPPPTATHPAQLDLLTIFRFVAALWVIVFHLQDMLALPFPGWSMHLVRNGAYAMSFFFVLSGTVLAYSYRQLGTSPRDLKRFYLSRFARLYPAYLLIHAIGLFWLPVPLSNLPHWSYINVSSVLGVQAWFPQTFTGINAGTWSVSCEFFFYLIFPLVLPVLRHLDTPALQIRVATYLMLFTSFIGLADFAFGRWGTFPLLYISPLCRVPEFLLGMIIGLSLHNRPPLPVRGIMVIGATALLLLASCNTAYRAGLWIRANLIVVPTVALLIYTAARYEMSHPGAFRRGCWRPLEYLGRASYCMFLVQLPILLWMPVAYRAGNRLVHSMAESPAVPFVALIAVVVILGILLHELIEKPARRWLLQRNPAMAVN